MTPTRTRIGVLAVVFGGGFAIVMLHLLWLMVQDHEVWARRSHENRWAFRSVPSQRGTLRDRHGVVLAYDEPSTELSVHYVRFRQRHAVGAAVHGATALARLRVGGEGTTYSYVEGPLGPTQAVLDLLRMPARFLRPRVWPKDVATELARAATTLLSTCSGYPRSTVYGALRAAAQLDTGTTIGEVLDVPASELLARYAQSLQDLTSLDAATTAERQRRTAGSLRGPDESPGLIQTLELLRRASLNEERVTWKVDGVERTGSLIETVLRTFADHVPFELAAGLRIDAAKHPGIEVTPSVSRACTEPPASSLAVLLGQVVELDRSLPSKQWFKDRLDDVLPDDWIDDLVPDGIVDSPQEHTQLQADAKAQYAYAMLLRERRGTTGMESSFDDTLMGRLGMRLIEHDSRRREHVLWSHLRVQPGDDVQLTLDVELQHAAERAVQKQWRATCDQYDSEDERARVETAIAVIDAQSGDILAYAGAPIVSPAAIHVPGVVWAGNGAIGSVVKPFVLIEQLQSEALGRPHRAINTLDACSRVFRYGGRDFHCSHAHWDAGRDPVTALAESCNFFFYQCGIGLGDDGLARALRRFGLMEPTDDRDAFAACWQDSVPGLRIGRPKVHVSTVLPNRAIGYGVEASPLSVARAYAAIATGCLPTVGVDYGVARPRVPMADIEAELDLVRRGLRQCVQSGTARRLPLLNDLQAFCKTGTAEINTKTHQNNAWFAGYLPEVGTDGAQLCFCAVVYSVPDGQHGAEAAGQLVVDFLGDVRSNAQLNTSYLTPGGGR